MKKRIQKMSLLLASILTFGVISGCAGGGSSSSSENSSSLESSSSVEQVEELSKVENSYRVELSNFEQWKPDFSLIRLMKYFGKVSRNRDKTYVKSGDYSAKIQPMGGIHSATKPQMYFPFFSEYYNFNYQDFTYVDYIDFWIYNDNDKDMPLNVGLVSSITSEEAISVLPAETFYLKAKDWTLVTYYVDFNTMSINQNITASQIMQIKGLYLEFGNASSADVNEAPVYYVDDLNMYYKDTPNEVKPVSEILQFDHVDGSDVYELCDFEKVYQNYIFSTYVKKAECIPTLSIVNAEKEGVDGLLATSGTSVLKVEIPAGSTVQGSYTELILSGKVMTTFFNQFFFDSATQTAKIPGSELKNYYLAYDVYVVGDVESTYKISHYAYDSLNSSYSRSEGFPTLPIKSGQWQTWTISLYDFASLEKTRNSVFDPANPSKYNVDIAKAYDAYKASYDEYLLNEQTAGYGNRITSPGPFRILYPEHVGEDRVMYIDNLRVYKA